MNKFILMGRLTADPEIRVIVGEENRKYGRFSVAVDRKFVKEGEERKADFFRCVVWNKKAEFAEKYLRKGNKVLITGRVENGQYTDNDGRTIYTTDVIVEDIEFADSKKNDESSQQGGSSSEPVDTGFMNIPDGIDEELPFA